MDELGEPNWIPWADWLLIAAGMISLLLVILPTVAIRPDSSIYQLLPASACSVSSVLLAGYTPAILAHYRLMWRGNRAGPRENPEPAERYIVALTVAIAVVVGLWVAHVHVI